VSELLDNRTQAQKIRSKVLSPIADAVRLVDHEERRLRLPHRLQGGRVVKLLGCREEEAAATGHDVGQHGTPIAVTQT
jgi:hypothetical protein